MATHPHHAMPKGAKKPGTALVLARKPGALTHSRAPGGNSPWLAPLVAKAGFHSIVAASRAAHVGPYTLAKLGQGKLAPNSPLIPAIAKALRVRPAILIAHQSAPPMRETSRLYVGTMRARYGGSGQRSKGSKGSKAGSRGTALMATSRPGKRGYNRLKRQTLDLREGARTLLNTVNVAIMGGESHLPPLPVGAVALLLRDYFETKGIGGDVVLPASYSRLFDRDAG